jgi:FkbM family methyltransferase
MVYSRRRRSRVHATISVLIRDTEVTIRRGHLAGLRLAATGSSGGYVLGSPEPAVQDALARRLRPGMSFYDVGANIGFFTLLGARLVGPAGHVVAFEPLDRNRTVLEANIDLNGFDNVTVLAYATGQASREGWLNPGDPLRASLSDDPRPGDIHVEMVAIDDLVWGAGLAAPDVVKLDVEGREADALQGMLRTLGVFAPAVIAEIHGDDGGREIIQLLEQADYVVAELEDPPGAMRHLLATARRRVP